MLTEIQIIKGCRQNSASAQQLLYTKYAPVLKGVCQRYIQDKEEAKDVLHDSFIKIFKVIGKYNGEGSFEGWLKRIVINVAIDHIKKTKKLQFSNKDDLETSHVADSTTEYTGSDLLLDAGFSAEKLLVLLHSIPLNYANVFNMFYIDQLSHKEISEALQIDEATSRSRLFRAKDLVKKELEKEIKKRQHSQII